MRKVSDVQKNSGRGYYIVVTPFFPTETSFRGPFIYDQVQAIKRVSDYRVVVFQPIEWRAGHTNRRFKDIEIIGFPTFQTPSYFFNGIFDSLNTHSFKTALRKNGIKLDDIEIVHCHTTPFAPYGLTLRKKSSRIRVLLQHHSRDPYSILYGKLAGWRPNLYYRARHGRDLIEAVDLNISVSKGIEANLLSFPQYGVIEDWQPYIDRVSPLSKWRRSRVKASAVWYNGVDLSIFHPLTNEKEMSSRNEILKIGCVGNFQKLKDQISLVKAVELLLKDGIKNIEVSFIGTGPELTNCKRYVNEHGLSQYICFLPEVNHEDLNDFFNTLDIFILPSVYEGFGCVYTEASAAGVPFMVCEGQGAAEYLANEERKYWQLKKHSPFDIAAKIKAFIKCRPKQHLCQPIDIDILTEQFLLENGLK